MCKSGRWAPAIMAVWPCYINRFYSPPKVRRHKSSKHVFLECLEKVKDRGLNVVSLTIDRHVQVAKHMRTEEPAIRHSFYSWHLSKNTENTSWDLGLIRHIQQKAGPLRLYEHLYVAMQCMQSKLWAFVHPRILSADQSCSTLSGVAEPSPGNTLCIRIFIWMWYWSSQRFSTINIEQTAAFQYS